MTKKIPVAVALFAILVAVSAGVVFVLKKDKQQKAQKQETEQERQQNQSQQAEIDTSNWQTYRNEEYGFEVKYPEGWVYEEKSYNDDQLPDVVSFGERGCAEEYGNVTACDYNALIDIYNADEYLKGDILNDPHKCTEKIPLLNFTLDIYEILSCRYFSSLGFIIDNYVFSANGLDFVLSISRKDPKYDEGIDLNYNPKIERAILESFRFIDDNQSKN